MLEKSFMPILVALGWLSLMLLLGVVLRAKIKVLQKFLFPACLIGGIIGFVIINLGWTALDSGIFTLLAFHLFSLGFISIGLTGNDSKGSTPKALVRGSLWMAILFVCSLCLQATIGGGVFAFFGKFAEKPIYEGIGLLVGNGFTQGPGQTVAIAAVWENTFKIPNAVSIGLTFAAVGFFVAAFVGVPLANWGVKKGLAANAPKELPNDFLVGLMEKGSKVEAGRQTTHSANIDTFAFQFALVFGIYFITYLECNFLKSVFPPMLQAMTHGFAFFYGLINAFILRLIMNKLSIDHLIDNNVQRRITGVTVDFMIVATMMAVQVAAIWQFIAPIAVTCVLVAIFTYFLITFFGKRVGDFSFERTLAMFGYCTGTAASGLLLLRIADPDFKTPVATEVGLMNLFCLIFSFHLSVVVYPLPVFGFAKGTLIVAATGLAMILFIWLFRFWKKPAW